MKFVKIFALLAVSAAAMMAFAATASATTVTSPTGTKLANGSTIKATSEGHVTLHNGIANISCNSTVEGTITANGTTGAPASGPISSLIFGTKATEGCTNDWVVHVTTPGTLSITHIAGTENGTLVSTGATVVTTRFGIECKYQTNNTTIGTVTGGSPHATLDITAAIPRHGGSFLCGGATANWTGAYTVTSPTNLFISH
jgi:hypothetical protein